MKNLIVVLLLCSLASPQSGVVSEAKSKLDKEHHEALVAKAKQLLEEKTRIEKRLAEMWYILGGVGGRDPT